MAILIIWVFIINDQYEKGHVLIYKYLGREQILQYLETTATSSSRPLDLMVIPCSSMTLFFLLRVVTSRPEENHISLMSCENGAGHKAKRLVLQCINGVSSNSVEGRTNI